MAKLRSIIFVFAWASMTLLLGIICLPCLLTQRAAIWFCNVWIDISLWLLRVICGLRYEIIGQLPPAPFIIASAHQSTLDTILLWKHLRAPLFILKRELYYIPIYGWYVWRSGQIAVNRRAKTKPMQQIISSAQRAFAQHRVLVIFPEGTRLPPGVQKPYQRGVALLSKQLQVPVVPVALDTGKFWPKHKFSKQAGCARLQILPAIAACGGDKDSWLDDLQNRIWNAG